MITNCFWAMVCGCEAREPIGVQQRFTKLCIEFPVHNLTFTTATSLAAYAILSALEYYGANVGLFPTIPDWDVHLSGFLAGSTTSKKSYWTPFSKSSQCAANPLLRLK
jgi:hypothetical protein